jgi:hypothetical protein
MKGTKVGYGRIAKGKEKDKLSWHGEVDKHLLWYIGANVYRL